MGETDHSTARHVWPFWTRAGWMRLVAELRRRGVLRAVLAYAFVTFAVLQVIEPVLHGLRLPEWFLTPLSSRSA